MPDANNNDADQASKYLHSLISNIIVLCLNSFMAILQDFAKFAVSRLARTFPSHTLQMLTLMTPALLNTDVPLHEKYTPVIRTTFLNAHPDHVVYSLTTFMNDYVLQSTSTKCHG